MVIWYLSSGKLLSRVHELKDKFIIFCTVKNLFKFCELTTNEKWFAKSILYDFGYISEYIFTLKSHKFKRFLTNITFLIHFVQNLIFYIIDYKKIMYTVNYFYIQISKRIHIIKN